MNNEQHSDPGNHDVSEPLRKALKEWDAACPRVPAGIDAAILRAARQHLKPPTAKVLPFPLLPWAAAAACAALLAAGSHFLPFKRGELFAEGDFNRDGIVDVLDAFHLARELESKAALNVDRDLNRDGVVDADDLSTAIRNAVRLPPGGAS